MLIKYLRATVITLVNDAKTEPAECEESIGAISGCSGIYRRTKGKTICKIQERIHSLSSPPIEMSKVLPNIKVAVIRMEKVPYYVDQSGLYAIEDAVFDLREEGKRGVFTGLDGQPRNLFEKMKLILDQVSEEFCFPDLGPALNGWKAI